MSKHLMRSQIKIMLTNITKTKTMAKHIQCDCKCKFNSATCKLNQNWNNETCQC